MTLWGPKLVPQFGVPFIVEPNPTNVEFDKIVRNVQLWGLFWYPSLGSVVNVRNPTHRPKCQFVIDSSHLTLRGLQAAPVGCWVPLLTWTGNLTTEPNPTPNPTRGTRIDPYETTDFTEDSLEWIDFLKNETPLEDSFFAKQLRAGRAFQERKAKLNSDGKESDGRRRKRCKFPFDTNTPISILERDNSVFCPS
ncbi:hypothetical protein AVEN_231466-1 [Araneus ventricosus]|uniref:Uncharacterized protein n=1 Tax=Araneus ventricosus TaxID=182803 RepID=A0A4Y2NMW1_ARAVE|nr:hypothetical protein AVEN_231466-1 [Araneus ventricosus]